MYLFVYPTTRREVGPRGLPPPPPLQPTACMQSDLMTLIVTFTARQKDVKVIRARTVCERAGSGAPRTRVHWFGSFYYKRENTLLNNLNYSMWKLSTLQYIIFVKPMTYRNRKNRIFLLFFTLWSHFANTFSELIFGFFWTTSKSEVYSDFKYKIWRMWPCSD